jgi:hypothetical protein
MQTRTKGIQLADAGDRTVDKQYRGERIFARLGPVSQEEAESWLRGQQNSIDRKQHKVYSMISAMQRKDI